MTTVCGGNDPAVSAAHPPTNGLLAQFAVLGLLAATLGLGVTGWLAGAGFGVASWLLLTRALQLPGAHQWGPASTVTLTRLVLIGVVTALVVDSFTRAVPAAALVTVAAVALVLDGVDGQVARRTGTVSRFGARFDVEADSLLVLVLSVYVALELGWWVLAIGAARYAFVAAARVLPWLRAELPPQRSRKVVAAIQGIVLVVASAAVLSAPLATVAVGGALILLSWSFGRDLGWLWQGRRQSPRQLVSWIRPGPGGHRATGPVLAHSGSYPSASSRQ